jgi:hypothetical protein
LQLEEALFTSSTFSEDSGWDDTFGGILIVLVVMLVVEPPGGFSPRQTFVTGPPAL